MIGGSAGALAVLELLFAELPAGYPFPVAATIHQHRHGAGALASVLDARCELEVALARDKEPLRSGHVYLAPPNYHLLVERDHRLALSVDPREHFSRPSIDVLFESAARAFREHLVAVLLTGANDDGAGGLRAVADRGGMTVVQTPDSAAAPSMPRAALNRVEPDHLLPPPDIARLLGELAHRTDGARR